MWTLMVILQKLSQGVCIAVLWKEQSTFKGWANAIQDMSMADSDLPGGIGTLSQTSFEFVCMREWGSVCWLVIDASTSIVSI